MTNKTMDELLDAPEPSKPMSRQIEELVNKFERSVGAFGVEEKFVVERRKELRTSLTKAYEAGQVEALETIIDDIDDRFVWAGDTHATSGGFEYLNKALMELIELIKQRVATLKAKTDNPTEQ